MKRRVPVVDGRVIAAERQLEIVVDVVADDEALHFGIEAGSGWSPAPASARAVRLNSPKTVTLGERELHVQDELAFLKARVRLEQRLGAETRGRRFERGRREIDIRESADLQGRVAGSNGLVRFGVDERHIVSLVRCRGDRRGGRRRGRQAGGGASFQLGEPPLQAVDPLPAMFRLAREWPDRLSARARRPRER